MSFALRDDYRANLQWNLPSLLHVCRPTPFYIKKKVDHVRVSQGMDFFRLPHVLFKGQISVLHLSRLRETDQISFKDRQRGRYSNERSHFKLLTARERTADLDSVLSLFGPYDRVRRG